MSFDAAESSLLQSLGSRGAVSDQTVIRFDHVTKTYRLYKSDRGRFLGLFNRNTRELVAEVNANDDLSFSIKKAKRLRLLAETAPVKARP